ncbi:hypothetical protein F0M37_23975 [Salmonella enterica subsp. enterica]|nr:hypothetical protein [Salmonella enterica subsp. enterica serovar Johannesburg]
MKKTLIALAVAASAVVSGSAMAWTANGTGGNVDLGGTLTPQEKLTPWEVEIGAKVDGLNAQIQKGSSTVNVNVPNAIPVLGIRTQTNQPFQGGIGISPQIDYHNAVDLASFSKDTTTLTLDVKNDVQQKIGKMVAEFVVGAEASYKSGGDMGKKTLTASSIGDGFFGGLPSDRANVTNGWAVANSINPAYVENYDPQQAPEVGIGAETFSHDSYTYSGFYGAGIPANSKIKLTLDAPVQSDAQIAWTASLPVTVSYQ